MLGIHQQERHDQERHEAVLAAVGDAVRAPSIFNTQPWQWTLDESGLTLHADPSRRLAVVDPDATLMLLSCGVALHHARVSLAAQGFAVQTERLAAAQPQQGDDGARPVPLARIRLGDRTAGDRAAAALRAAIPHRRTDRRPFGDQPVPAPVLATLRAAAEGEGVALHRVRLDQMPMLAVAAATAGAKQRANPRYRIELIQWTNRPEWSRDGVPVQTAVRHAPRRVAVRDFTLASAMPAGQASALVPEEGIPVPPGGDRGASYLVLHGPAEQPVDWLRAGEALSAVLLTATAAGLGTAAFTDVLEVAHSRDLVRGLLPDGSHPYVVVRVGYVTDPDPLPAAPRREVDEVLHIPATLTLRE